MTPLQVLIQAGQRDRDLFNIINDLELLKKRTGISVGEQETLDMAYSRLEVLTDSEQEVA